MRKVSLLGIFVAVVALSFSFPSRSLLAADWNWLNVTHLWGGTPVDVHQPQACEQCGHEGCVERTAVEDCVVGKKKEFKTSIRCEYVSIP